MDRERDRTNRLARYRPYPRQAEFHAAGAAHRERLFMAGNQLGKTMMGAVKRSWSRDHAATGVTVGGTGNAVTLTYAVGPTAYVQGEKFAFKATAANTGAATVNVQGLGAKNVFRKTTTGVAACAGGEIQAGDIVELEYDGTQFQIVGAHSLFGDYAEGSWTPAIGGSTTPGTQTYAVQVGRYIRVGNLVTVWFNIALSAKDPATAGSLRITGLPFTASSVSGMRFGAAVGYGALDLDAGYTQIGGYIDATTSVIQLVESGDNLGPSTLAAANLISFTAMVGSVTYRIN
jgi:hypothetical protein